MTTTFYVVHPILSEQFFILTPVEEDGSAGILRLMDTMVFCGGPMMPGLLIRCAMAVLVPGLPVIAFSYIPVQIAAFDLKNCGKELLTMKRS